MSFILIKMVGNKLNKQACFCINHLSKFMLLIAFTCSLRKSGINIVYIDSDMKEKKNAYLNNCLVMRGFVSKMK